MNEKHKLMIKIGIAVIIWTFVILFSIRLIVNQMNTNRVTDAFDNEFDTMLGALDLLDNDIKFIMEGEGKMYATPTDFGYQGKGYTIRVTPQEDGTKEYVFYLGEKEIFRHTK